MYFNQTDIVHLKSLIFFLVILLSNTLISSLCCADETIEPPIQIMLSQHYNQIIKLNLPTIIIKTTPEMNGRGIRITDIIINDGRCRTNIKRRRLLPKILSSGLSIEIGLMLGCQVENIVVLTESESNNQSWKFLVSPNTGKAHVALADYTFIGEK